MKRYFYLYPVKGNTLNDEIESVLNLFQNFLVNKKITKNNIIKLSVFIDAENNGEFKEIKSKLQYQFRNFFDNGFETIAYIGQGNVKDCRFCLEILYINDTLNSKTLSYKTFNDYGYTIVNYHDYKELYVSGLTSEDFSQPLKIAIEKVFETMENILNLENMTFSNVIRQWNYIENILGFSSDRQNYSIFNELRSVFYTKNGLTANFPAATGIGMKTGHFVLDFIAVSNTNKVENITISNPNQVNPYQYSEKVIVTKEDTSDSTNSKPKFERALLNISPEGNLLYISGTAAILGESTVSIDSIDEQTEVTIENIKLLINNPLFSKVLQPIELKDSTVSNIRIYIKNKEDYPKVKRVCENYFTSNPILYLISDVCRNDLLVEIEGIFQF